MVVRRQRDAAHLHLGVIRRLGRDGVDGDGLKHGFHRLLAIHGDGGLGGGADLSTRSVLPLLEAVAEVLRGFQCHSAAFLILLQLRFAADAASLSRYDSRGQRVFRHLGSGTDELALNHHIGETHRLGISQTDKGKFQLQRLVSGGCEVVCRVAESSDIQILAAAIDVGIGAEDFLLVAGLGRYGQLTAVGSEACTLEAHLGGNEGETVFGRQRQRQGVVDCG